LSDGAAATAGHLVTGDADLSSVTADQMTLHFALKVADLSHFVRGFAQVHMKFVDMVKEEFYRQGDREVKMLCRTRRKTSPLMDRNELFVDLAESQVTFIQVFIKPLFTEFARARPCRLVTRLEAAVNRNLGMWQKLADNGEMSAVISSSSSNCSDFANDDDGEDTVMVPKYSKSPKSLKDSSLLSIAADGHRLRTRRRTTLDCCMRRSSLDLFSLPPLSCKSVASLAYAYAIAANHKDLKQAIAHLTSIDDSNNKRERILQIMREATDDETSSSVTRMPRQESYGFIDESLESTDVLRKDSASSSYDMLSSCQSIELLLLC
jgi:hypothetical protein